MSHFVSIFRKVVGRKVSVGVVAVALVAVVGGGSKLLLSMSTHAAIVSSCPSYTVTVQPGDTLSGIAAAHNASVQALAQANHIANVNLIYAGQNLCIPIAANSSSANSISLMPTGQSSAPAPAAGGSIRSGISQVFGPYAGSALQVASCESGFNPNAYSPKAIGNSHAEGVFQILYPSTWSGTPYAGASPYDAWSNINAAHAIFVRDGYSWREWQCQP